MEVSIGACGFRWNYDNGDILSCMCLLICDILIMGPYCIYSYCRKVDVELHQCGRSSSFLILFSFSFLFPFSLFRFLFSLLLFSPLPSALCHSFGSCWRQITGPGGLYLLYWALDSQVCIQCWWMFLMSRAQCECECGSVCVCVYTRVCVCGNVCRLFKVICMGCRKRRVKENKGNWEYVSVCYT